MDKEVNNDNKESNHKLFMDINLYIEIYNNKIDQSDILDSLLTENGATV